MSQPCRKNSMAGASTPFDLVLMVPAGQMVVQRTIRRG
jgi:hypothetical protein